MIKNPETTTNKPDANATPRSRRFVVLAVALLAALALVGAGCGKDEPIAKRPATAGPPSLEPSLDDYTPKTQVIHSPDGRWTATARYGPDESFDLVGPGYSSSVQNAFALEFSPDSRYFAYLRLLPEYGRSALFAFDTVKHDAHQLTNKNLPTPPLTVQQAANLTYGPVQPLSWEGHVLSWSFPGKGRYHVDLDSGDLQFIPLPDQ